MNDLRMSQQDFNHLLNITANMDNRTKKKSFTSVMIEAVETERKRRFEIIMDVPPEMVFDLTKRQAWPWS